MKSKSKPGKVAVIINSPSCTSEVTIYRRAVPQLPPEKNQQLNQLIVGTRAEVNSENSWKVSSSSDEIMDTSDKNDLGFIVDTGGDKRPKEKEDSPLSQADELIRDVEKSSARIYDMAGKDIESVHQLFSNVTDIAVMDNNYQMIDVHIDDVLRKKIISYNYVDFSKLLPKNKREDDQRLEIVNRNGMTFLSLVSERDNAQISSYGCWEQVFRVYSNVLTTRYPNKSPELLQYNHTIHTSSTSFVWDNVYSYDKEFRRHISRFPNRAWNVILQQAWTMLLKDRVRYDNGFANKKGEQGKKEICKRFNKGRCSYGLACKFNYLCAIPKCGKFGHGAHVCRMRDDKVGQSSNNNASTIPIQESANKE